MFMELNKVGLLFSGVYLYMYASIQKLCGAGDWRLERIFEDPPSLVNLCPAMRTVLIWGPLVHLFTLAVWLLPIAIFLVPVYDYGWAGFKGHLLIELILGVITTVVAVSILWSLVSHWFEESGIGNKQIHLPELHLEKIPLFVPIIEKKKEAGKRIVGGWELLRKWLQSTHDSMCPPIELSFNTSQPKEVVDE